MDTSNCESNFLLLGVTGVTGYKIKMTIKIVRNAFKASDTTVRMLKRKAKLGEQVFNPDSKRMQMSLDVYHPIVKRLWTILKHHRIVTVKHMCGGAVILHSKPGCKRQQWHTDYDPDKVGVMKCKPKGIIVALENHTKFVTPMKTFVLQRGDIISFDGDEIHAGSDYTRANTRIHVYADTFQSERPENVTWLVSSSSCNV